MKLKRDPWLQLTLLLTAKNNFATLLKLTCCLTTPYMGITC